jgi:hypothetical protein
MTQEEKDLLLKDLCGRLPYGVKIHIGKTQRIEVLDDINLRVGYVNNTYADIKPYLFPLSNMTEEQYKEWCDLEANPLDEILTRNANGEKMSILEHHLLIAKSLTDSVNYCYKNHFDIYGLIPMGLANDATGKNIY